MLKIGDFAGITGLSVKALRHYDDTAVLSPEAVDARSGYRWYAEDQVRSGVVVRALRAAGVPLPEVREAAGEDAALGALAAHRARVLAHRAAEDRAHAAAVAELEALAVPVAVVVRERGSRRFVGRLLARGDAAAAELTDDAANDEFADLYARLVCADAQPTGAFWTTMRTSDSGVVELVGCWEVQSEPPASALASGDRAGMLGQGPELVATWRPAAGEELPDGATHPAVVALFDELGARGIEHGETHTEIRQTVLGQTEDDFAVEIAIDLAAGALAAPK